MTAVTRNEEACRARRQPRRLVLLFDGTWNSAALRKGTITNVARLRALAERSGGPTQKVFYLHGVGRGWSAFIGPLWKFVNTITRGLLDPVFGGASGWGLSRQIREGYALLVREYLPGDEIFIFGFSRGAYAARSLVGLVQHAGLLTAGHERQIQAVTHAYHRLLRGDRHKRTLEQRRRLSHDHVRVRFLGLWDTVGAMGAPVWGGQFSLNPLPIAPRFHAVNAMSLVDTVCHAVAIDEQRVSYTPVLVEPDASNAPRLLRQEWFRGAHADVGGGYEEVTLSLVPLQWMLAHAHDAGLVFEHDPAHAATKSVQPQDSIGPFWLAGVWPRPFPLESSGDDMSEGAGRGRLHPSVNVCTEESACHDDKSPWLIDLEPGEESGSIVVRSDQFWNNTRVIIRAGARYRLRVEGRWQIGGRECGPEGVSNDTWWGRATRRFLRVPTARLGELLAIVNAPPRRTPPTGRLWHALAYLFWKRPEYLVESVLPWSSLEPDTQGSLLTAEASGVLHLSANSIASRQRRSQGSFTVRVVRELDACRDSDGGI